MTQKAQVNILTIKLASINLQGAVGEQKLFKFNKPEADSEIRISLFSKWLKPNKQLSKQQLID